MGLKVFPLKGYEINGWYMYRAMVNAALLEAAFAPGDTGAGHRGIREAEYQELGVGAVDAQSQL